MKNIASFKFRLSFKTVSEIIVLGTIVREVFSFWTGHPYDFEMFVRLGEHLVLGRGPYEFVSAYPDVSFWPYGVVGMAYPPLYAYFSAVAYIFYKSLNFNLPFIYYFILKQPIIFGDIFSGYLIYKIILQRTNDLKSSLRYASLWILNPIVIIFSIWGIPHSLAISFVLLALLKYNKSYSIIFIILAFLIIGLPFIYIFPYLFYYIKNKKFSLKSIFFSFIIIIVLAILPLFSLKIEEQYYNLFLDLKDVLFKGSLGQFTAFYLFTYLTYLNSELFIPVYIIAASIVPYLWLPMVIVSPFIYFRFTKLNDDFKIYLNGFLISTIIFLIFRQSVNEQYLLYFLSISSIFISINNLYGYLRKIWIIIQINLFFFIIINNVFLIRLLTPIDQSFYIFDINLTTGEPFRFFRFTSMVMSGSLSTALLVYFFKKIFRLI